MMALSHQFGHPGGMPGHGGIPHGHPMAPGHPSNQGVPNGGQPGVTMAQQMHAMGGPQATQGPMMGLPQGPGVSGGPSAHAMQHLNPQLTPQFIQNQQQMQQAALQQQHPQLLQQQQLYQSQQQALQKHRMMLAQQQQQQQNGGMMMNPSAGFNMSQMRPGGPVHLPVHLQQQMHQNQQHQQLLHQQQAQQAAAQQQQQQILAMQQHQQAQQQHHAQQQHAASQAGSVQGHPASQPPMRPPSTIQTSQDPQAAAAVAAAQAQAQQQAQAQNQAQQAQSQPQNQAQAQIPPQPTSQQGAQPNSQQVAQQPPQPQGTPQPSQSQQQPAQPQPQQTPQQPSQAQPQGQPSEAAVQQVRERQAQMAAAQASQLQQNALMARMRPTAGGSILRLHQFGESLGQGVGDTQPRPLNDMQYWKTFVSKFFSDGGVLRQELSHTNGDGGKKAYELSISALPRYYWTHYNDGVQNIQMIMAGATEKELGAGGHFVESAKLTFIYWYANGTHVVTTGNLKAHLNQQGKIDMLELGVSEHTEYVQRSKIILAPESPQQKHSPNLTKGNNKKAAAQQKLNRQQTSDQSRLSIPKAPLTGICVPAAVAQVLETAEVLLHMEGLFEFSRNNPNLSGPEALRQLVSQYQNNMQNVKMEQAGVFNPGIGQQPQGQRTPGPGFSNGPQQFASPTPGAHLNLPTTASPASMNMSPAMQARALQQGAGGVTMVTQASQQGNGNGSQGVSANASPNHGKRRRASVKAEPDGDGPPEVNGVKVKASPKPGGKRQKP